MKLAAAAAQQLKGVVVEYDVLCGTLLGASVVESAAQRQRQVAALARRQARREALGVGGAGDAGDAGVGGMFVSDVRALLKELRQDSTGKPWVVKDRLEKTLQGLPAHIMDRVTGQENDQPAAKTEGEMHLESQLASAAQELERRKQEKEAARRQQQATAGSAASSIRDKYLDKINMLKAKLRGDSPAAAPSPVAAAVSADTGSVTAAVAAVATSKGLTTWIVNEGTNDLLSYADMRGLFKAVLPPRDPLQQEEFELFMKEMKGEFDTFMTTEDYEKLPDPQPIAALCKQLGLDPPNVMVLARHAPTIRAAKAANAHTCHYIPGPKDIPNHSAHHLLKSLKDFQYLVEDFNGISYRGRIKNGTIVF